MATGSYDSDTARNEQMLEEGREGHPLSPYKALWAVLLLGWIVSYADRTLTGPVIAWMIQNKAGFIGDAANPATLGGLVGSMFFLGYMLTQYPGGRLGDRFGHREMIIVSLLAACVLNRVRVDGRARRLRRRPRADRPRRGRLLLQRPDPDHQPHPGRQESTGARHRDR